MWAMDFWPSPEGEMWQHKITMFAKVGKQDESSESRPAVARSLLVSTSRVFVREGRCIAAGAAATTSARPNVAWEPRPIFAWTVELDVATPRNQEIRQLVAQSLGPDKVR
jgi:hypothetical protein